MAVITRDYPEGDDETRRGDLVLRIVDGGDIGTSESSNRSSSRRLSRDGRRHRDDRSSRVAEEDDLNECTDQSGGDWQGRNVKGEIEID